MKILNKYFIRQLTGIFIMLMLVLTGLAWMVQVMSMMKFLLNYGIEFTGFLGLTALMVPFIISIIMPFVTFIATIFVYNRMIADNEVTVMAASGMSPKQIAKPALTLALALTLVHLVLNIWVVPSTQAKFYDTQWEMRYGLAHMKLTEAAFTKLSEGLVVYVDKVSGYDLSQIMLNDARDGNTVRTIFAEKGKLVATSRGLSIIMGNGSVQMRDRGLTVGRFDTFDMDLEVEEGDNNSEFRARRISTRKLIGDIRQQTSAQQHKQALSELATRILSPVMNLILAAICVLILLKSSLLRRRASFAPVIAVAAMGGVQSLFMSSVNLVSSITGLIILAAIQMVALGGILLALFKR